MPDLHVLRVFVGDDGRGGNPLGVFVAGHGLPEERYQPVAADLGFSETVFVEDAARGVVRIFTPGAELPLAGHPLVGTAWLLREHGFEPKALHPPAGEVAVRFDGELTCVAGQTEWAPPFEFVELGSAEAVDALDGPPPGYGWVGVWAWIDEARGLIRERVFVPEAGVPEDEATGSAAMRLCALLGREVEIRQGRGSVIWAKPLGDGTAEIRGRVAAEESRDYPALG